MKQVNEFPSHIQLAALQYVAAYQKDSEFRGFHLTVMRQFDELMPELAECIDTLLFVKDMEMMTFSEEVQQAPYDHEYWSGF
jgi:hypothetical protein